MIDRRLFLKRSATLVAVAATPFSHAFSLHAPEKSLHLVNTHTGETFNSTFWAGGRFLPDALARINVVLRDHRSNKVAPIDPVLLSLLEKLSADIGASNPVHVISGYRSPETNQMLAERSNGVARHSLHLEGKAIDIRVPGRDLKMVHKAAANLRGGGVGYYPDSQFVHIDTGRIRSW